MTRVTTYRLRCDRIGCHAGFRYTPYTEREKLAQAKADGWAKVKPAGGGREQDLCPDHAPGLRAVPPAP